MDVNVLSLGVPDGRPAHAELLADADDIRQRILDRAHGEIQPELVESIATACGPADRWLLDQGVELGGAAGGVGSVRCGY
jgi:hypothetical protein